MILLWWEEGLAEGLFSAVGVVDGVTGSASLCFLLLDRVRQSISASFSL